MNVRGLILTFGLLPVLTATASASPIPVANFSFETLPPGGLPFGCSGTGCAFSEAPIPGWTNSGVSGQFQPGSNTLYFNFIPDGSRVAYSNDPGGTITQTVGATVAANTNYTLRVDLGLRKDGFDSLGTVQLLVGSTPVIATGVAPSIGNWSTFTATYNSVAADIGKTLTIQLTATGSQSDFDNVRLDGSPTGVPEPVTTALVGVGLAVLGVAMWRRSRTRRSLNARFYSFFESFGTPDLDGCIKRSSPGFCRPS
jgi:hypothetical protein